MSLKTEEGEDGERILLFADCIKFWVFSVFFLYISPSINSHWLVYYSFPALMNLWLFWQFFVRFWLIQITMIYILPGDWLIDWWSEVNLVRTIVISYIHCI